ncbi:thiosulfate dehydrogenase [quinone] large subunit [Catenuloplanes indicus]|uniref:Thiosulfate dehydrogenase [quinone] large subunit n=1 Tax=Catenuloplanes indicus TaxID=137267 RepID=A0AAE3VX27_9ACTN|nr:DoxX family membrane protein [Catenuloplanes indicus]MDQ0365818.1 thiosulfate dehydrogenase [quinone] large subunit [Catenuloplanes indicus]
MTVAHTRTAVASKTVTDHAFGEVTWAVTRVGLGFVFLWAFLDKLFGLGKSTPAEKAWLNGGQPTKGFLAGVEGPFAGVFNAMSGNVLLDWLFMAGLAGIGVALILGIGMRIAAVSGVLMMVLMWAASLPIATNPFLDDHLIYALVIAGLAATGAGLRYSLAATWAKVPLVGKAPWLK